METGEIDFVEPDQKGNFHVLDTATFKRITGITVSDGPEVRARIEVKRSK